MFSSDRTDKFLDDRWIFRIIKFQNFSRAQQQTSIISTNFSSCKRMYDFFFDRIKSNSVAKHFQVMQYGCFSAVRFFQLHIVIGSCSDIFYVFHIIIHTLDHMMTGRTESNQILTFFLCLIQSSDRRKLRGNLIAAERIYSASALPIFNLFQFKSQYSGRCSRIRIQILRFGSECTSRIITVFHRSFPFFVQIKYNCL